VSSLRKRLANTGASSQGKDDCVFDVLTAGDLEMAMLPCLPATGGIRGVGRGGPSWPVDFLCLDNDHDCIR
jgi:hypothetical protein